MGVATSTQPKLSKNAVVEMLKEAGRIAFFAAVTALVGYASDKLAGLPADSTYVVVGTVVLRLIDKYIHISDRTELKGIAPF